MIRYDIIWYDTNHCHAYNLAISIVVSGEPRAPNVPPDTRSMQLVLQWKPDTRSSSSNSSSSSSSSSSSIGLMKMDDGDGYGDGDDSDGVMMTRINRDNDYDCGNDDGYYGDEENDDADSD